MACQRLSLLIAFGWCQPLLVNAFSRPGFTIGHTRTIASQRAFLPPPLFIIAPPGSGYVRSDDNDFYESLPDTYEPMMGYPGTMRPGKTPENIPYQDLPIADTDPDDPVPWPHFQQIEWHHRWSEPPNPHPGTMEDFIARQGRWATPEQEAAMRAGTRQGARALAEKKEDAKRGGIITDDDDDDDVVDEGGIRDTPLSLGDGMFGKLGSDDDRALTEAAVDPNRVEDGPAETTEADAEASLDDFLLDLGLDLELGDDTENDDGDPQPKAQPVEIQEEKVIASVNVDDKESISTEGLDAVGEEEDSLIIDDDEGTTTIPLEDYGDGGSDEPDVIENFFEDGGFDLDDGGDFDFDDPW